MIEFKSVRKSFGSKEVLKDVSFKTSEGEILFVLGTSGTGKSVLLKLLVGLLPLTSGEIWLDGELISQLKEEEFFEIRKKCGMVFQHPALFDSISVYENIAFGLRRLHQEKPSEQKIKDSVYESLSLVDLSEDILDKKPASISYGMQKRVSLARTIAMKPSVLLFDEPTTGLDPVTTQSINRLISDLSKKLSTTSIVVSHDMDSALTVANKILVLDKGLVVENTDTQSIRKSSVPLVKDFLSEILSEENQQ